MWGFIYNLNRATMVVSLASRLSYYGGQAKSWVNEKRATPMATRSEHSREYHMLARLCHDLQQDGLLDKYSGPGLTQWYTHANPDKIRLKIEALNLLTNEQKEALGL